MQDESTIQRVLIAEDHPMYADALEMALQRIDPTIHVVKVDSLQAVRRELSSGQFTLLLLDPGLPDSHGIATVATVRGEFPEQRILVITANDGKANQRRIHQLGAAGFLAKSAPYATILSAIISVASGKPHFEGLTDADTAPSLSSSLSPAQHRVLGELVAGHSNKEIAYRLGLAEQTVKTHVSAILRMVGVNNRSQAILALRDTTLI